MTRNTSLRPAPSTVLVLGAAPALTVPGTAYANTVSVTVKTPGATSGPASANSAMSTHADCADGLVSGGGINQAIGTGAGVNGNHVNGTSPSSDGTTEYTGSTGVVGTDVTHWLGIGGSGGRVNASFSTTPYAMCFTSSLINHTQVVMNKANSPTAGATVGLVTATCPADTRLLGGAAISGGNVTTTDFGKATSGGPHLSGSFPSDAAGTPVGDWCTDPSYWTAATHSGGSPSQGSYSDVWALCLDVRHGHKRQVRARTPVSSNWPFNNSVV